MKPREPYKALARTRFSPPPQDDDHAGTCLIAVKLDTRPCQPRAAIRSNSQAVCTQTFHTLGPFYCSQNTRPSPVPWPGRWRTRAVHSWPIPIHTLRHWPRTNQLFAAKTAVAANHNLHFTPALADLSDNALELLNRSLKPSMLDLRNRAHNICSPQKIY